MKICAVSDLHGNLPTIPPCDLLIIAGDVCPDKFRHNKFRFPDPDGQFMWLSDEFHDWLKDQPTVDTVMTFGNHDWQEHRPFGAFIVDRITETSAGRVWLSPWSNEFCGWAFMKPPTELAAVYDAIPEGTDIIVSHQPPYGYGDMTERGEAVGSHELLAAIDRVKPKLVFCGHIHGGYGRYERNGTVIYNVSVVDEGYHLVNAPTVIEHHVEAKAEA